MTNDESLTGATPYGRREFLSTTATSIAATFGVRTASERRDSDPTAGEHDGDGDDDSDRDRDGIPDALERSSAFHDRLEDVFGDAFDGLDPDRPDFLVDVRCVGDATVDDRVGRHLEALFRDNGIHMQWLPYPERYDPDRFAEEYGNDVRKMLWSRRSFYRREVEPDLRNVAFQLLVVPGKPEAPMEGRVYSPYARHVAGGWHEGWVNGLNVGNRAVVGHRDSLREQARLALHEIAHLVLCHDDDPSNPGVMGTQERVDLTDAEWTRFRNGLDAVRDTTGYDVVFRRCLWTSGLD